MKNNEAEEYLETCAKAAVNLVTRLGVNDAALVSEAALKLSANLANAPAHLRQHVLDYLKEMNAIANGQIEELTPPSEGWIPPENS